MSDLSVSIGGKQPLSNAQVRIVRQDAESRVQSTLQDQKDGLDTIGFRSEGIDYLITGAGLDAKMGDTVQVEGKAVGTVSFVEQEANTFAEGFKAGINTKLAGLEHSVAGAPFQVANGLYKGLEAMLPASDKSKALDSLTQGPALKKGEFNPKVEANDREQFAITEAEDQLIRDARNRRIAEGLE